MNIKKYLPYIILVIVLALLWKTCRNASNPEETVAAPVSNIATPGQKLASLDIGSTSIPFETDAPEVKKIDALLAQLSASYKESPDLIGNATYSAFMRLNRGGHHVTNLSLLQHMVGVAPVSGVRYKLAVMQYASELEKK